MTQLLSRSGTNAAAIAAPCASYRPPATFALGAEAEVARFNAELPHALSCVLFETRYPEPVFNACVRDGDQLVARFRAAPGLAPGTLLADLCQALAEGSVCLESDPYAAADRLTCWTKTAMLIAMPYSSGQDVDLYRAKESPGWSLVAARPGTGPHGKRLEPFNLYVLDPVLAERLGQAAVRGTLSASLHR